VAKRNEKKCPRIERWPKEIPIQERLLGHAKRNEQGIYFFPEFLQIVPMNQGFLRIFMAKKKKIVYDGTR